MKRSKDIRKTSRCTRGVNAARGLDPDGGRAERHRAGGRGRCARRRSRRGHGTHRPAEKLRFPHPPLPHGAPCTSSLRPFPARQPLGGSGGAALLLSLRNNCPKDSGSPRLNVLLSSPSVQLSPSTAVRSRFGFQGGVRALPESTKKTGSPHCPRVDGL